MDASWVFATVIVNDAVSVADPSDTLNSTRWSPTSAFVGVPTRVAVPSPPSVRVSQAGTVVPVYCACSLPSGSVAVIVYE